MIFSFHDFQLKRMPPDQNGSVLMLQTLLQKSPVQVLAPEGILFS
jgi:hypothetical protein